MDNTTTTKNDVVKYELTTPVTVNGICYTAIELDFYSLNGNDITTAEFEIAKSGQIVAGLAEFNKTYLMHISARAAKIPFEALNQFSIRDISAITRETQNFLMS